MTHIPPAPDERDVRFITPLRPREGFTPHRDAGDVVTRKVRELREDYREIISDILAMVESSEPPPQSDGLRMQEIQVDLGFDARGKLGFIAGVEAGVQATVSVRFARPN